MITSILSDPSARLVTFGPDSILNMPRPAAVKTGTTDNYRDTWTIGYTPNVTIGVWVGNTDNHPMREVLSSMSAGKVWRESMDTVIDHYNLPPEDFVRPAGLVDVEVCGDSGMRPGQPGCYKELFPFESAPNTPRVNVGGYQEPPRTAPAPAVAPAAKPVAPVNQPAPSTVAPEAAPGQQALPTAVLIPAQPPSQQIVPGQPVRATPPPQPTAAPKPQAQPTAAPKPQVQPKPQQPAPTPAAKPQPKPQAKPEQNR
jgi:membrane peptidoglycan carboxypeptidase